MSNKTNSTKLEVMFNPRKRIYYDNSNVPEPEKVNAFTSVVYLLASFFNNAGSVDIQSDKFSFNYKSKHYISKYHKIKPRR